MVRGEECSGERGQSVLVRGAECTGERGGVYRCEGRSVLVRVGEVYW